MKKSDLRLALQAIADIDPDLIPQVIAAPSHEEAMAVANIPRVGVRAIRRLAATLTAGGASTAADTRMRLAEAGQRVRELEEMLHLTSRAIEAPSIALPRPRRSLAGHVATAHVAISDIHTGLVVRPDMVDGLNEYNLNILKARAAQLADRIVRLTTLHQGHRKIVGLVLWLLGDFIENELHDGSGIGGDTLGPIEASMYVVGVLESIITRILAGVGDLPITAVVLGGNHDRATRKMQSARAYAVSHALIIGGALETKFSTVRWVRPTTEIVTLETADGHVFRGTHGHMFQYNRGTGGPEVSIRRALKPMDSVRPAHCTVMGHFHRALTPGDVMINGAFCGTSPWSLARLYPHSEPEQLFWLSDSHYGISAIHRIRLEVKP